MIEKYEVLMQNVQAEEYECISFDVFDTLIWRPFGKPEDLFLLLDEEFEKKFPKSNISFQKIRIDGENGCRKELNEGNTEREDVTIEEIYRYISENYDLEWKFCQKLMETEKDFEVKFSMPRKSMYRVYDAAKMAGKKIIFVTDMYLDRTTILRILNKNNYHIFHELYISSEVRKLKNTGSLYDVVLDKTGIKPEKIFHIGDNWISDCVRADEKGIIAAHFPKAQDVFQNKDNQYQTGNSFKITEKVCGKFLNYEKVKASPGYGCMEAIVANTFFDNPFSEFQEGSLFNNDPYYAGYFALGMHMLGLMQWLGELLLKHRYACMIFTSRDGWLPMKAYQLYREVIPQLPEARYLHVSRRALLSVILDCKIDFYDLPIEIVEYTPNKVFSLLSFCRRKESYSDFQCACEEQGIHCNQNFTDNAQFRKVMQAFLRFCYDEEMHYETKKVISRYLTGVPDNSLIFDMGYSGRIHKAICMSTGKKMDAAFIHSDCRNSYCNMRRGEFTAYCFYDFIPWMSDFLREYIFSEPGASCVGYEMIHDNVEIVFEDVKNERVNFTIAKAMQEGCLDFLKIFYHLFGSSMKYVGFKSQEVSLPFESFLRFGAVNDKDIFSNVSFEDTVYAGKNNFKMQKMIEDCIQWLPDYAK